MQHHDTIIIGGGPAGSSCAGVLTRAGHDVLVLDKAAFPRLKLCAGWITEKVMADLGFTPQSYPHGILKMDIRAHLRGLPFALPGMPTVGDNYSIRRTEFDAWLLERSGAPVVQHQVRTITRQPHRGSGDGDGVRDDVSRDATYVIDDTYTCRHLVGAGGTMCPVRRALFPDARMKSRQIATLEKEFAYPQRSDTCHLYFLYRGLQGYAWFVPKADGMVNIGIGGKSKYFRKSGTKIHDHFRAFIDDLVRDRLLDRQTADGLKEGGHPYFLYTHDGEVKRDTCYLIGDSAGLASVDLGEGLGPGIESGIMAAREILGQGAYDKTAVTKYSLGGLAGWLAQKTAGRRHTLGRA